MNDKILIKDISNSKLLGSYRLIKRKLEHSGLWTKTDRELKIRLGELRRELRKRIKEKKMKEYKL